MAGRILIFLLAAVACAAGGCSDSGDGTPGGGQSAAEAPTPEGPIQRSRPTVVQALAPGQEPGTPPPGGPEIAEPEVLPPEPKPADVAATDEQLLGELETLAATAATTKARALLQSDGTASAPIEAPPAVQEVVHAGNLISKSPYKWGGGHGRWLDDGYDCSGSVSFALFAGGLLGSPLTSGGLMSWGRPGPGRWVTIYANPGHVYMVVAGLRFDTSGRSRLGSRWQAEMRPTGGYAVRHPPGL